MLVIAHDEAYVKDVSTCSTTKFRAMGGRYYTNWQLVIQE
jgi:hypothetical protein